MAATLFVIIGTGVAAAVAGLSMALGAFIAGLLLAETEFRKAIETAIGPFKGLLLGFFFFTVGMNIDVRELAREPFWLLASVVGLIAIKSLLLIGLARIFRLPWHAAIETGLLLGPGGEFAFVGIGLATTLGLIGANVSSFILAVTSITMALIPALSLVARRLAPKFREPKALDPELNVAPSASTGHAIVIGHGRVGEVVCALLGRHCCTYIAVDNDADAVPGHRRRGREVYYGNATDPEFLKSCGVMEAKAVIVTVSAKAAIDEIVREVRALRADIVIVSRARDADHARHLYAIGVTDAVPETIEASLQLSEAALIGWTRRQDRSSPRSTRSAMNFGASCSRRPRKAPLKPRARSARKPSDRIRKRRAPEFGAYLGTLVQQHPLTSTFPKNCNGPARRFPR